MSPYLLTEKDYSDKQNANKVIETRADKKSKKTTIYAKVFNRNNSPLIFRNFMTISTSENFLKEAYVDNEFYVKEIQLIDKRHFERWKIDAKGNSIYVNKYMKGVDFYRIPGILSATSSN
jgi:hypothetical protein